MAVGEGWRGLKRVTTDSGFHGSERAKRPKPVSDTARQVRLGIKKVLFSGSRSASTDMKPAVNQSHEKNAQDEFCLQAGEIFKNAQSQRSINATY